MPNNRMLVALGGNALIRAGQEGTIPQQMETIEESLRGIVELIRRGYRLVITHGNGPQVGHILIRSEEARGKAYELPLDVCVAQSQGEMGYLIQRSLQNLLRRSGLDRPVATVLTQAAVAKDDPRMKSPSKPVGPSYAREQVPALMERGWTLVEDSGRGYRRVVASPLPLRIVEAPVIRRLFEAGVITVAVGGGGIPVRTVDDATLVGVEAVIDKDLASSLLANAVGADTLLILTSVPCAKLNFGTPREQDLGAISPAEAQRYLREGHFAPGSMRPKIEAALDFLERGGRQAIITLPETAIEAVQGRTGTIIRGGEAR